MCGSGYANEAPDGPLNRVRARYFFLCVNFWILRLRMLAPIVLYQEIHDALYL